MTEPVRSGGSEDLPAVAALAAEVLPAAGDAASLGRFLARPSGRLWVVPDHGPPAGFLLASHVGEELEILWMGVAPAQRRRGLGQALVESAAESAAQPTLHLEVRSGNRGARAFYAALGFREAGGRPRYYADGEDAIRLVREPTSDP